jgi:hypothetical protein
MNKFTAKYQAIRISYLHCVYKGVGSFFMPGADRVQMLRQIKIKVENIDSWYPDLWNK